MTGHYLEFHEGPKLDLTLVIVSFNTRDLLLDCLKSVYRHTQDVLFEVRVVDNRSGDGSAKAVRELFPEVHLTENDRNRGFSTACNQAIRQAKGRLIVLLNPDTRLLENSFLKIGAWLDDHPDVSVLSPAVVDAKGAIRPMRLWEDTPKEAIQHILGSFDPAARFQKMGPLRTREVDVVGGSCFVVRRVLLEEVGLLDESYFLYNEEDDFCRRAREAGAKIVYYPQTKILHLQGKATHQPQWRERVIVETYKSNLYFFAKHYSTSWNLLLRFLYRASFAAGLIRSVFRWLLRRPARGAEDSIALKWKLLWMPIPRTGGG